MSQGTNWQEYEQQKAAIRKRNLSPDEYEKAIRALADKMENEPSNHPTLIGRCGNQLSRATFCLKEIWSNEDYETINNNMLICEGCVDAYLSPKTSRDDPEDGRSMKGQIKVSRRSAQGTLGLVRTRAA